jgi:histidinol-phosphate aminotransferase
MNMSRYWSSVVNRLTPYVPGEQPKQAGLTKLNTNENPYGPSPAVMAAIESVTGDQLRLYPDPESQALKEAFANRNGIAAEQVFLGNGSDEVLAHVFQALLNSDKPVCFPEVSYSFYPVWCELYGLTYLKVPLSAGFVVDIDAFPADNGGIVLANPNAPTGIVLGLATIREFLEFNTSSVVVVDEAYIDFGGESAVSLIDQYDNLLVVQTVSKSRSLAGLRVGVAMGHRDLIMGLERLKNSFNSYPLDILAQQATLASLHDDDFFRQSCDTVIASRERLTGEMCAMGFEVLPSAANFIFATHPGAQAVELFEGLRRCNILVRYFDGPKTCDYLRISIGTDQECDLLLTALVGLLAAEHEPRLGE